jgi:2-oxoglutarate/2-oxoacid ferredoxin oxidoreductase subunit beta
MTQLTHDHPIAPFLRMDRIPHIWCPTCGIGIAVKCFAQALEKEEKDLDKVSIVSGIGCTGRVAGYVKLDSFHSTHGRAIPFATGLKVARPDLDVVVFSGDGDLTAIGGNHFIHAARRNMDLLVICVNNFIYGMTGGQAAPTTPVSANTSTTPYGAFEQPFNIPHLASACGASYVARWTVLHVRRLEKAMREAMNRRGFRVIEIIAPCSTLYARRNRLGSGYDLMKFYHDNCEIKHGAPTEDADIGFQDKILLGRFVDRDQDTWDERMVANMTARLGDKFRRHHCGVEA